jgi:hypothetical protein
MVSMHKSNFAVVPIALILASCGAAPDVLDNVPVAGNWSDTLRLVSLSSDGAAMSEEDLPSDYPKTGTQNKCEEPKLRNGEELREAVGADFLKKCDLGEMRISGANRHISATCKLPGKAGIESEMTMDISAVEGPEAVTINLTGSAIATAEDGEMASFEINYRRELKRIGDC